MHNYSFFAPTHQFLAINFVHSPILLIAFKHLFCPSMGDSSASYIHMVQHLIEKCIIFHMTKEECMEALFKHANIKPVITSTVWKELEKENKEFFEAYAESKRKDERMSEEETSEIIQKLISQQSSNNSNNNNNKDSDDDHD